MSVLRSRMVGAAYGLPSIVLDNKYFESIVDTTDEWIRTRTGIRERRRIDRSKGESLSGLAIEAARKILNRAGISPSEISQIVCCTATPDTFMPNAASRIAGGLEAGRAGAIDVNGACSGFLMGLHIADAWIRAGMHKKVLVVGGDIFSGYLDMEDRSTCVIFGDGCGVTLLEAVSVEDSKRDSYIIDSCVYSQFDKEELLSVKGGGSNYPFSMVNMADKNSPRPVLKMAGQEVFKNASRSMADVAKELLSKNGYTPQDLSWIVPHQANVRILEMVARLLDVPMEKVYVNIDRWGNTSAGTVPICLGEMEEKGLLKRGDLILLDVFGGGFSYGGTLIRW